MSLLPYPTCPTCGQKIDLSYLYSKCSQDRNGVFKDGPIGIGCPHCRKKLKVDQFWEIGARWVVLFVFVSAFSGLLIWLHPASKDESGALVALFLFSYLPFVFSSRYRRFAKLADIAAEELQSVRFPLETKPENLSQAEIEEQNAEQESHDWATRNRISDFDKSPSWRCPECKEENPASFEVCWKCECQRNR